LAFGFRRAQCGEARLTALVDGLAAACRTKRTRPDNNCQAEPFTDYPPANAGVNEIKL